MFEINHNTCTEIEIKLITKDLTIRGETFYLLVGELVEYLGNFTEHDQLLNVLWKEMKRQNLFED